MPKIKICSTHISIQRLEDRKKAYTKQMWYLIFALAQLLEANV